MPHILIVEDIPLNVDLLVQLLEDDYTLSVAADGEAGVAQAAAEKPDLILMDMSLPGIDGYEATRRIKGDPALAHVVVLGLSAHAMSGDREKALEAGCDDYLTKPLDDALLFGMLERYLREEQARQPPDGSQPAGGSHAPGGAA
ncbi:MAG: response regulator [Candidatus Promineifilaceae bacterium]|nr:response regulator [Candidatus Promineifilaceae bacterium]